MFKGMGSSGLSYFNEHENSVLQNILHSGFILSSSYIKQ